MKVPTFRKYGITKSQIKNIENRVVKVTHYLTHLIPILIGISGGIILYLTIFRNISPHGVPQYIQRVFVFGTIIIICIGISMMLFKGIYFIYNSIYKKSSDNFKKVKSYTDERDKYEFWKLRMDENYWISLDSLSIENELLKLYSMMGYRMKSEISNSSGHSDYILGNEENRKIYISCYSLKKIQNEADLNEILPDEALHVDEFHLILVKGYEKNLVHDLTGSKTKLFTPAGAASMINEAVFTGES